ncbi:hypothetical protein CCUS01_05439, partial [Colletotrichum cuscutae]
NKQFSQSLVLVQSDQFTLYRGFHHCRSRIRSPALHENPRVKILEVTFTRRDHHIPKDDVRDSRASYQGRFPSIWSTATD